MAVDTAQPAGFYPFEVTPAHLAYTLLGAFTVIFGMFSSFFKEKCYLGEAPIATVFGIILGPHVAGLIDPYSWGGEDRGVTDEITLEVTRVVIAVAVFAVGVELPKKYMLVHWRTMFFLLLPCMLWGWFVSALLMWALIPGLKFLSCLLIAAAVTPTDPILAQSVIGGSYAEKHVPAHIRHMLSAESGSNDGAAFPFLYIALYLTLDASPGHAIGEWFYATIAYEIVLGTVIGVLLGWLARKVMMFSEQRNLVDRQSFVAFYVSLALLSMGGTVLLGSDDLLSAFACGCAFAWNGYFNRQTEDAVFSNVVDLLFNCAAFIYIGALIPFPDFNNTAIGLDWWRLFVLAICILLLRRLPSVLLLYKFIPDIKTFREALFTGWFGPMGVGAVFIATLARHSLPYGDPDADTAQVDRIREIITPITLFLVLSSVVTHGLSIPFFSLSRRVHSITYTFSRQLSIRDNQPAWTSQVRHVQPGQTILVNRDEDGEEGDIGLNRGSPADSLTREKLGQSSTGESSSDRTGREEIEMSEKRRDDAGAENDQGGGAATGERAARDDRPGTPPVMEYREGNDLIIERKRSGGQEVEVELIKNHFTSEPTSSHNFTHPQSLASHEVSKLRQLLPSLDRFASDFNIGSHLGRHNSRASRNSSRPGTPSSERDGPSTSAQHNNPHLQVPAEHHGPFAGIRQRFFGRRSSAEAADRAESGQSNTTNQDTLSPMSARQAGDSRNNPLELSRTQSINRTIRFAQEVKDDSDTAPTPTNYGNNQPGFRRNPGLAMFRTSSIKSQEGGS